MTSARHEDRSILLIRLKSMGDIVFTLPAIHILRKAAPDARISFLVSKEYAPMLQGFRDLNTVIELDRQKFRTWNPLQMLSGSWSLLGRIRAQCPGLAIDFQGYGETALLTRASGAPERWGTVYRPGRSWAYTGSVPRHVDVHPAEDYLLLLRRIGFAAAEVRNEFVLPAAPLRQASELFSKHGLASDRRTLFIQAFTSAAVKNWPLERYLSVAQYWRARNWQILFGGGPADRLALEPARQAGFVVVAGAPLLVSAGLAQLSTLVLGGDTGLLHLAVAMAKRVVMIMKPSIPGGTHPFQHPDWAVVPSGDLPLSSITVEAVNGHCSTACKEVDLTP